MKKILFKYENDVKIAEIKGVNKVELLAFICESLESLIQKEIISREELLTAINICHTIGTVLPKEAFEDKEIKKLINEFYDSMVESLRGC